LHLESSVDVSVPDLLSGDRYRVEHVLSNLLSNAIKFSPKNGAIRIHVTAEAKADAIISVTVSITDEGPGISAEDQKRLFESFFQIRPNQLQQGQGSGLGLSLCKQIVALHCGTIEVTSTEGAGSTFSFTIPFGVVASDAPINVDLTPTTLSHTEQKSDAVDLLLSRHCHILIVDGEHFSIFLSYRLVFRIFCPLDVSSNRKILKMLLARTGAVIDMAENGQEAVTKVQQMLDSNCYNLGGYDIVFMDNLMPVMVLHA
jgi:CheY-like chemotaxis protein